MIIGIVSGNLGKDAELRDTSAGPVLSFGVASNAKVKGDKVTTWVRCSLFGKRASKLAQYLTKGIKVTVSGTLSTREYEGKTYLELRVDQLEFMGVERNQGVAPPVKQQSLKSPMAASIDSQDISSDEVPF